MALFESSYSASSADVPRWPAMPVFQSTRLHLRRLLPVHGLEADPARVIRAISARTLRQILLVIVRPMHGNPTDYQWLDLLVSGLGRLPVNVAVALAVDQHGP